MRAETLLRQLHLQKALSDDELTAYLAAFRADGSLPPGEIPVLLELMAQRSENLSFNCIRELSSLAGAKDLSANAVKINEDHAIRSIVSKLAK
jgi:hypothetical protein